MCKESPERGLGKVYTYGVEGSDERGSMGVAFRPGKTARDRNSGALGRRLANRAERGVRARSGAKKRP
jgi:hypothetical protein